MRFLSPEMQKKLRQFKRNKIAFGSLCALLVMYAFSLLSPWLVNDEPLIFDDFAHNPDGIKATISETLKLLPENQTLYVVCAIRGSRGVEINELNVEALVESMDDNIELILSSSNDVVNNLNWVNDDEREVFFDVLGKNNVDYIHYDDLKDCLSEVYKKADKKDIILLIGAQGMDPAESLLNDIK